MTLEEEFDALEKCNDNLLSHILASVLDAEPPAYSGNIQPYKDPIIPFLKAVMRVHSNNNNIDYDTYNQNNNTSFPEADCLSYPHRVNSIFEYMYLFLKYDNGFYKDYIKQAFVRAVNTLQDFSIQYKGPSKKEQGDFHVIMETAFITDVPQVFTKFRNGFTAISFLHCGIKNADLSKYPKIGRLLFKNCAELESITANLGDEVIIDGDNNLKSFTVTNNRFKQYIVTGGSNLMHITLSPAIHWRDLKTLHLPPSTDDIYYRIVLPDYIVSFESNGLHNYKNITYVMPSHFKPNIIKSFFGLSDKNDLTHVNRAGRTAVYKSLRSEDEDYFNRAFKEMENARNKFFALLRILRVYPNLYENEELSKLYKIIQPESLEQFELWANNPHDISNDMYYKLINLLIK